jgi:phosphate transport system protein
MAIDLRETIGALRIVSGLERMGDYAKNIAKLVIATGADNGPAEAFRGLERMVDLVQVALRRVLDAYARRDVDEALAVWRADQAIDAETNALIRELIAQMTADQRKIPICTHLLFCAKNIERFGDHATNIAETVYYIVHGTPLDTARPKGELAASSAAD